jgi:hypothetical protein
MIPHPGASPAAEVALQIPEELLERQQQGFDLSSLIFCLSAVSWERDVYVLASCLFGVIYPISLQTVDSRVYPVRVQHLYKSSTLVKL